MGDPIETPPELVLRPAKLFTAGSGELLRALFAIG